MAPTVCPWAASSEGSLAKFSTPCLLRMALSMQAPGRGAELRMGDGVPEPKPFCLPQAHEESLAPAGSTPTPHHPPPHFNRHDSDPAVAAPLEWTLLGGSTSPQ